MPEDNGRRRASQDLLYLQAASTSPTSEVIGIALFVGGEETQVPSCPDYWPYRTPLEAIKDGWRVVKFPELALILDEDRNYGLGCEFILERFVSHPLPREAVGQ